MNYINDTQRDAQLDRLIANCDKVYLYTGESTVYATIVSAAIGEFAPTITKADYAGVGLGRQASVAAAAGVSITAAGTLDNYAFVNTVTSEVIQVNPSQGKTYAIGDKADVPESICTVLPDAVAV